MGGCASKPNDLDTAEKAPAPVEAPAVTDKAVVVESSSEPLQEAANIEEAEAEQAVQADEPKEAKTEAEEQVKETPTEEKKEVAETAATA